MSFLVVTVGREYGSGGHEIGKKLAEKMEIAFYDKEILTRAAKESGISRDVFESYDEKVGSGYLFPLTDGVRLAAESNGIGIPLNYRVFLAQFDAITKIASEGPCVIVGRCGDYILKEQSNIIRIFLYADVETRVQRIMGVENVPYDRAKDMVRKVDKQRQNYYNFFADGNWGQRRNYDLTLRTEDLTMDEAAEVLAAYIRRKKK